jgi:hypothetical protein
MFIDQRRGQTNNIDNNGFMHNSFLIKVVDLKDQRCTSSNLSFIYFYGPNLSYTEDRDSNEITHSISRMIESVMGSFNSSGNTSQV